MTGSEPHEVGNPANLTVLVSSINDTGNGTINLPSCTSNCAYPKKRLVCPYFQAAKNDAKHVIKFPVFAIAITRS